MENIWGKEEYTKCYIRRERNEIVLLKAGIRRLRGIEDGQKNLSSIFRIWRCYTYTTELSRDKIVKNIMIMQIMAKREWGTEI